MPGPRIGPRPHDFDEALVKSSPTFLKWETLESGETLRYACRDFVKGNQNDEERLMRRIMIARRNNIRDHEILKKARATHNSLSEKPLDGKRKQAKVRDDSDTGASKKVRSCVYSMNDDEIRREMDVEAVEKTRSYRSWMSLEDGQEFVYNQKYIKGKENHDWLVRKNIWRRMRYRRENRKILNQMKFVKHVEENDTVTSGPRRSQRADSSAMSEHSLASSTLGTSYAVTSGDHKWKMESKLSPTADIVDRSLPDLLSADEVAVLPDTHPDDNIVEAAVAAAESYMKQHARETIDALKQMQPSSELSGVQPDPSLSTLDDEDGHHTSSTHLFDGDALDVAAKLAAAASGAGHGEDSEDDFAEI